jgi:hypothetical protein
MAHWQGLYGRLVETWQVREGESSLLKCRLLTSAQLEGYNATICTAI